MRKNTRKAIGCEAFTLFDIANCNSSNFQLQRSTRSVLKNVEKPKQFVCMFKEGLKEISILFFQVLESLS